MLTNAIEQRPTYTLLLIPSNKKLLSNTRDDTTQIIVTSMERKNHDVRTERLSRAKEKVLINMGARLFHFGHPIVYVVEPLFGIHQKDTVSHLASFYGLFDLNHNIFPGKRLLINPAYNLSRYNTGT